METPGVVETPEMRVAGTWEPLTLPVEFPGVGVKRWGVKSGMEGDNMGVKVKKMERVKVASP